MSAITARPHSRRGWAGERGQLLCLPTSPTTPLVLSPLTPVYILPIFQEIRALLIAHHLPNTYVMAEVVLLAGLQTPAFPSRSSCVDFVAHLAWALVFLPCRHPTQFFGVVERTGGSESIVTPLNETDGTLFVQLSMVELELRADSLMGNSTRTLVKTRETYLRWAILIFVSLCLKFEIKFQSMSNQSC